MKKLQLFLQELRTKKELRIKLGILLVFAATYFWLAKHLDVALIILAIVMVFLCIATWSMASIVFFRSLFVVGGGLSLMIFLAQMYCAVPAPQRIADNSLKLLLSFGLLYMGSIFIKSIYEDLMGNKESEGTIKYLKKMYKGEIFWVITTLILYIIFICVFVWQLCEVMGPIFFNLCIYK